MDDDGAAMEPAVERREHMAPRLPGAARMCAAMEPAVERRELEATVAREPRHGAMHAAMEPAVERREHRRGLRAGG